MRIAYVCADPGIPVFGTKGGSIHVQEIIRSLNSAGHQVTIFAVRFDGPCSPDLDGIKTVKIPLRKSESLSDREDACLATNTHLLSLLDQNGPFDLVYERYSLWSLMALRFADTHGIPSVLEVNAPLIAEQLKHRSLARPEIAEAISRFVFGAASVVVAVSAEVGQYVMDACNGQTNVAIIPNGINPSRFSARISDNNTDDFVVGFVGSLKRWHGLQTLLEAFKLLQSDRRKRLLIVGDGPERDLIEHYAHEQNIDHAIEITGKVAPSRIPEFLSMMDVGTAPYGAGDFYFSPLKILEYMAAEVCPVVSGIGQINGLIDHLETGLIAIPGSAQSLADNLAIAAENPRLTRRMASNARRSIINHTWDSIAAKSIDLAFEFSGQSELQPSI